MNSKAILIAIAAFAVTASGANAYGGTILSRAGLNDEQVAAVEDARELRAVGKFKEARDRLLEAGIGEEQLQSMHRVASQARMAIRKAVEARDYEAFQEAVAGSPLSDIITTEADFRQFCEAHELQKLGDRVAADEIMDGLGIDRRTQISRQLPLLESFTNEQKEALRVARQANDRATIQAIFDEAGYDPHPHHRGGW